MNLPSSRRRSGLRERQGKSSVSTQGRSPGLSSGAATLTATLTPGCRACPTACAPCGCPVGGSWELLPQPALLPLSLECLLPVHQPELTPKQPIRSLLQSPAPSHFLGQRTKRNNINPDSAVWRPTWQKGLWPRPTSFSSLLKTLWIETKPNPRGVSPALLCWPTITPHPRSPLFLDPQQLRDAKGAPWEQVPL